MKKYSEKQVEQLESNNKDLFNLLNEADKKNVKLQEKLDEIDTCISATVDYLYDLYDEVPSENNNDKLILAKSIKSELIKIIER